MRFVFNLAVYLYCFVLGSSGVESLFDLNQFTILRKTAIPEWMSKQIARNFSPFLSSGISMDGINKLHDHLICNFPKNSFYRFLRFRVVDGVIFQFRDPNRPHEHFEDYDFYQIFLELCKKSGDLPNVDFIIHFNDATPCEFGMPEYFWLKNEDKTDKRPYAPLFTYGMFEDPQKCVGLVHVPWYYSLMRHNSFIAEHEIVTSQFPWDARLNKAVWRGATSDLHLLDSELGKYTANQLFEIYRTRARYRVCELSLSYTESIDAGFSSDGGYPMLIPLIADKRKPWSPSLTFQMDYKYLINLDGWGWSNNFWWGLAWGAVCIKPEQGMTDWFYSAFEPYKHYLPVRKDLSNLVEMITWAQEHDDECKTIASAAAALFRKEVTNEHGLWYFYLVLKEYERLQDFKTRDFLKETLNDINWERLN